ncbi:MAG: hypothetical protein J3K34DRAFT_88166 [Monoraphidium minutum]|nr:MAG: hypothetical protein J3K34DRAFT_88166 [Monoraphidium minutum]
MRRSCPRASVFMAASVISAITSCAGRAPSSCSACAGAAGSPARSSCYFGGCTAIFLVDVQPYFWLASPNPYIYM